ncbi:MAG TPA: hypothetical protein VFP84_12820 [Kofleriaceae bacterium]|nr:hypothetical protein [Kofleriaceae bacterium]
MIKRLAGFLLAAATAVSVGCGPKHASFVKVDEVALGRVVIYRNGVAFYERRARVAGGVLTVSVPRDRVDDFLKSLTVVDAVSRQPLPVSIPRRETDGGANLTMQLQVPGKDTADVVLTYVTESPAWKPSYRVVVGDHRDVLLEGWAIVDNTSGEDWNNVLVGVGSSSALSFRYDLWSVRQVQRATLASEARFAIAPPTGGSPYGGTAPGPAAAPQEVILDDTTAIAGLDLAMDGKLAGAALQSESIVVEGRAPALVEPDADSRYAHRGQARREALATKAPASPPASTAPAPEPVDRLAPIARAAMHDHQQVVIEVQAVAAERARQRAEAARDQLVDRGVAPGQIKLVTTVEPGKPERVRLVAQAAAPGGAPGGAPGTIPPGPDEPPVGESHFENKGPMTVARGSSAMVSMVRSPTEGEVVYLYDAESERGNANFAFRAVRFKNPTDSTLETGPVTVYGHERFIGEGLTEPIPPRASAVVPFALDRQIVVERQASEDDKLARLVTLQRGILTADVQHIRRQQLTITNRQPQVARVFIRHTVAKGWALTDAPPAFERIGDAHLFEVQLAPGEVKQVTIAEATPLERTLDLAADPTLDMMRTWLDAPEGTPELKDQLRKLLGLHKTLVDLGQAQDSLRRRLADYRGRMDELHAQIVTLQAVRTGGDLMAHLKTKMKEISDRVQKTTIEIVDQEEKIMLARVRFKDALSELSLPDALAAAR